jgi:multidrug efflux pump subunit AcrA (membrane-fusion protein)
LSDEAAIRADRAALRVAKQNRAAATLRSPISGRVGSVGLTAGNDASAGSIVVTGTGAPTVTLAVPLSQVSLVHRGEHATVQVDGKQQAVTGTVSSVGVKADTSSGAATFPVTVQLGNDSASLVDGVGADVTLTVGRAKNVLLLPNSAISAGASGSHTVTVVSGSTTSTAAVTLGVVGEDVTEVLTGLRAGQRVLLADASASLPSSSTSSSTSFGAGGFGGAAGGFAGGFGPPPGR